MYWALINGGLVKFLGESFPCLEDLKLGRCASGVLSHDFDFPRDESSLTWARFWEQLRGKNPRLLKVQATDSQSPYWDGLLLILSPYFWSRTLALRVEGQPLKWPYAQNAYPRRNRVVSIQEDFRQYCLLEGVLERRRMEKETQGSSTATE